MGKTEQFKVGDRLGQTFVGADEKLFAVAEENCDGHFCDDCELPIEACACGEYDDEDAAEYVEYRGNNFQPGTPPTPRFNLLGVLGCTLLTYLAIAALFAVGYYR